MKGRKNEEIEGSSRGVYIRNADIMPNWSDICSTAEYDVKLSKKEDSENGISR